MFKIEVFPEDGGIIIHQMGKLTSAQWTNLHTHVALAKLKAYKEEYGDDTEPGGNDRHPGDCIEGELCRWCPTGVHTGPPHFRD